MSAIFLSYRRTDGPQACRVHDWLALRFGQDAVFMDVSAIPFAVSYPEFIRSAIGGSRMLIALIGRDWHTRMQAPDDPVRMELEIAFEAGIPILPVLIGLAPMPGPEDLPPSVAAIATQNAAVVGVLRDFDTHMRALLPKIEAMLGAVAAGSIVTREPRALDIVCNGIVSFLSRVNTWPLTPEWSVIGPGDFYRGADSLVSLYLHRISHLGDVVELHVLLSFWFRVAGSAHVIAGLVMQRIEREPIVPPSFMTQQPEVPLQVKLRRSDEDPRQVWRMVTEAPLQLSLAYVATVSAEADASETAPDPRTEFRENP